jgi:hypothetical protein
MVVWADNETRIDLLGFGYLVDSLLVVLTETRLLPVTVGISGDWGSGKTSLMSMAAAGLRAEDSRFLTVSFSPWRFEDYNDVKAALMAAVIDALQQRVDAEPSLQERVGDRLRSLRERVWRMGLLRGAATGGALLAGADPALAAAAGEAAQGISTPAATPGPPERYDNVARFRTDFSELMRDLGDEVRALVVFVDDLDRCLTDAVVETFEAIRLFLHVEKTAYVIGADQRLVQAAIEDRYPAARESGESLGRNYLEKIVQVTVAIPPLSEPEVETYLALLLAQLELDDGGYAQLLLAASAQRTAGALSVAMNEGIAREALGNLPDGLAEAFALTRQIAPTLAAGLRGNPRQLKRFMNTFVLRRRTAARRDVELQGVVLAKLMVLEELAFPRFQQLFGWQLEQDGQPQQLAAAELTLRASGKSHEIDDDTQAWLDDPQTRAWLELDPPLAETVLGPYFFFSRDRLSPAAPAARLSPALQELVGRLCTDVKPRRVTAMTELRALAIEEQRAVYTVLLERVSADPGSPAADSALDFATDAREFLPAFIEVLQGLPLNTVPTPLPLKLRIALKTSTELDGLFGRWENGPQALNVAVKKARSH